MFVPTTFGKYFLTGKIATGGMAEIYRGKLLGPGGFEKQLVIKQIHPRLVEQRAFVDLFVAEAKTSVALSHGNIVPIYELGVVDGTYFIAMEFVDGPTLAELGERARGKGRRLGPAVAATIAAEVLKGLDYAHRKGGVIHRDLSPRNVMVSRDGEVKIVDFGLAASFDSAARRSHDSSGDGRPVGSFPYMSPEQAARAPLDQRSDLFSVGILLWEMLAGATLFQRDDDDATLAAVARAPVPPASASAPEVPAALDAVVRRALERDPAKRWASAADFLAALGRYLFALDAPVGAAELAAVVAEVSPDVPDATGDAAGASGPAGGEESGTRPMKRIATVERSFATHVELERALDANRTPLMPFPALEAAAASALAGHLSPAKTPAPEYAEAGAAARAGIGPAADAPRASQPAVTASARGPSGTADATARIDKLRVGATSGRARRRWIAVALVAAVAGGTAAVLALFGPRRDEGPSTGGSGVPARMAGRTVDGGDPRGIGAAGRIADAGTGSAVGGATDAGARPPTTAPVDAAPAERRPAPVDAAAPAERGRGRLIVVAPDVAWASVFVDGVRIGETPLPAPGFDLPAGRHTLRVVCDPAVCPPAGREHESTIVIGTGAAVERIVTF